MWAKHSPLKASLYLLSIHGTATEEGTRLPLHGFSWCTQMATICCISWRSEPALWNSVCWHWMNGLSKCGCCVCGWWCVWGGFFFFSLSVFKHSPGLYRIIDFLLVASLTFSVSSLWTMGLASFFLPELSQDVICLSSFYSSNQCSWVI